MKFRVVTSATVERIYYVDAVDEKDAVSKSVDIPPDDERDICEEVLSSRPAQPQSDNADQT